MQPLRHARAGAPVGADSRNAFVPALRVDTFDVTVVDSVVMLAVEPAWPPDA